jgi:hypothetical protein
LRFAGSRTCLKKVRLAAMTSCGSLQFVRRVFALRLHLDTQHYRQKQGVE